ncbi:TolC family protein [Stenoxybacter acetivorans]|uniref:TolC family protein n=1 Tax=Stenoxybacter acetivorans TaxID=422441 RepID=UPI0009FE93D6|nr:TolC family protein [Stenoxybacter acetivorans]
MKKKVQVALSSVSTVLYLSACAVSTPYPQQQLTKAGMLSEQEAAAQYQTDRQWWTIYGDSQLNHLVQSALNNNVDLKQAAINAERARFQANDAGADLWPQGSGSIGASVNKNLKDGSHSSHSFSGKIGLNYELDLWQRVRDTAAAAGWEYRAAEEDVVAARLSLVNSLIDAYFQLTYVNEAIALTEKSIAQYQEITRIATTQYKVGKVSSINPTNANQSLLSAENALIGLRQNRQNLEQNLRNLLNIHPNEPLNLQPIRLTNLAIHTVDLNIPLSVLSGRPDLRAAEYRLQKAYTNQQASQKSWYPSISLSAAVNTSSDEYRSAFNIPIGAGAISINLPFLDWQHLHWQNKQAEAAFESAKLDFEKTLTTSLNEVSGFYTQYQLSRDTLANIEEKHRFDQKNSRYYQIRYQYGANPLSDWLSALNTELSSAQNLLNNRYTVLKNENLIYQAMAGRYLPLPQVNNIKSSVILKSQGGYF